MFCIYLPTYHFQTVHGSLTVFGQKIEFVNLRSEEYAEDSRIPTIKFGTPLEDALRRDATINSLFYNVHKRAVEDQTEKVSASQISKQASSAHLYRRAIPSSTTLCASFRCIRFASKFGFELDSDVRAAAADPEIQQAIMAKVSRERVGIEVEKMLTGRDPPTAIELIHDLSLYHTVFAVPPTIALLPTYLTTQPPRDPQTAVIATILVQNILSSSSDTSPLAAIHKTLLEHARNDKEVKARLYMGAAVTPFEGFYFTTKNRHVAQEAVIGEGLRLGTQGHYRDGVPPLFGAAAVLHTPQLSRLGWHPSGSKRVALGVLLKFDFIHNPKTGTSWQASVLFSLIQELVSCYDVQKNELDASKARPIIETYNTFVTRIEELDLPSTLEAKPILDGNTVLRLLGYPKSGPWIKGTFEAILEWQLEHPAADAEACEAWFVDVLDYCAAHLNLPRSLSYKKPRDYYYYWTPKRTACQCRVPHHAARRRLHSAGCEVGATSLRPQTCRSPPVRVWRCVVCRNAQNRRQNRKFNDASAVMAHVKALHDIDPQHQVEGTHFCMAS
ncbi:poly A polymerase C-terminal region-like protein [Exidia glandulosa HHB12029]|uniref:Poly A polymerase C-terminal region-like protein n=1 Tax=Exidia glandulosa HHB12029 TaxID=1314781 RepID=A0A165IL47_EXIGL|nr:poly A polymerase C-terminal region-like protein [Exidia glandulosa HHB12029]